MAEPLSCLAGTLLPRTLLRTFPDGVPPEARDLQTSALEALGNSKEVVEQARCMLGSSDATDHPQQRRRGLGRKRARFSMKPPTSKESANAGIKLDIDKLSDPEEYFSAAEKIEIADRELKKLKGQDSTDQLEHKQVAPVRKRRPGIRGKISSYRHSFGVDLDRLDGHLSAEEVCKRVTPEISIDFESEDPRQDNSCNAPPKTETRYAFSNATEEDGSAIERESGARHLLNTLLSSFETLDDHDGAVFLQEKLQLKEINVDRMRLPVTPPSMKKTLNMKRGVQNFNKVALTQRSTAHNGSPLASISRLCKQSFQMDLANDPYSSSPSPTKGRSSRESSWKKSVDKVTHKLSLPRQVDTTVKIFDSAALSCVHDEAIVDLSDKENIDKLPRGNETVQSSPKMGSKFSDKLDDSPFTESIFPENLDKNEKQDIIETSKCSRPGKETIANRLLREKETVEASPKTTSNFLDKLEVSPSTEAIFSGTLDKNEKQDTADLSKASRRSADFRGLDGSAKMRNIGNNMSENLVGQESRPEYAEVLLHEDSTPVVVTTPENGDSETSLVMQVENDELELPISEELDPCMERPGNEKLKSTCGNGLGDSSAYDANNTEPCIDAGVCESGKEQLENDMALERNSHVSPEGNPKEKKAHRRRVNGKSLDKRKSLAEAGTKWEAGLRRSTRNRIRPLEFWRGERLLYGRIHDSLATVIGIKCSSPGNSTLKVKSYVSEDYADLLERASLH